MDRVPLPAHGLRGRRSPFCFSATGNKENRMPSNIQSSAVAVPANTAVPATAAPAADKPVIIATRQRCEADGVGLSHYILVDRKVAE